MSKDVKGKGHGEIKEVKGKGHNVETKEVKGKGHVEAKEVKNTGHGEATEVKGKDQGKPKEQKLTKILAKHGKNTPWWLKYQARWAESFYYRPPKPPDAKYDWKAKTMEIYKARDQDDINRIVVCEDYHSFVQNLHTTSTIYSRDTDDENQNPEAGKKPDSDEDDKQWEEEKELSEDSESDPNEGGDKITVSDIGGNDDRRLSEGGKRASFNQQRLSVGEQRLSLLPQTAIEMTKPKEQEKGSDYEADYENDDIESNTDIYTSDEDAKPYRVFGNTSSSSSGDESSEEENILPELTEKERADYHKYIEDYFKKMMDDLDKDNVTEDSTDTEDDPDNAIDLQSVTTSEDQLEAFFTLIDQKIEEAKQQPMTVETAEGEADIVYKVVDDGKPGDLSQIPSDTILPEPKPKSSEPEDEQPFDVEVLFENKPGSEPKMNKAAKIFAHMSEDRILADLGLTANERAIAKTVMREQMEKAEAEKTEQNKKIRRAIIMKTCFMMFFLLCFWVLAIVWIILLIDIDAAEETIGVDVYKYYYIMSARIPLIINVLMPIFGLLRRTNVGIRFCVTLVNVALFYYVLVHLFILIPLAGDITQHYMTGGLESLMLKRMVQSKVNQSDPLYNITNNWGIGRPKKVMIVDVSEVWHQTHKLEKCCGIKGPSDWNGEEYPYSCCKNNENKSPCLKNATGEQEIWEKGCYQAEWEKVKFHGLWYLILCIISILIALCTYIVYWNFREFLKVHRPYWIIDRQDTYSHDVVNMKDFPRKVSSLDLPDVTYFNMETFNKDIYGIWPYDAVDIAYPARANPEFTERQVLVLPRDQLRG